MAKQFETKDVAFNIDGIELLEKTLAKPPLKNLEKTDFEFHVGLEVTSHISEKKSRHKLDITINSNKDKEFLARLIVATSFVIHNIQDLLVQEENNQVVLLNDVVDLLNTIAIGVGRGALFSEFRGTFVENAVLPILDVKRFENSD